MPNFKHSDLIKCPKCGESMIRLYAEVYVYGRYAHKTVGWICPRCLKIDLDGNAREKIEEMMVREGLWEKKNGVRMEKGVGGGEKRFCENLWR